MLNQPAWRSSCILIAGENFGCGSSREMAVWAVRQFGFRCIIAPSFAPIFRQNSLRNGLLPITLPAKLVEQLSRRAEAAAARLDGRPARLQHHRPFGQPPHVRDRRGRARAAAAGPGPDQRDNEAGRRDPGFVEADRRRRPWIWAARAAGCGLGVRPQCARATAASHALTFGHASVSVPRSRRAPTTNRPGTVDSRCRK